MRSICLAYFLAWTCLQACAGGSSLAGNSEGSQPLNPTEESDYKRAILKCYKTGGSRIVKIEGRLMCY